MKIKYVAFLALFMAWQTLNCSSQSQSGEFDPKEFQRVCGLVEAGYELGKQEEGSFTAEALISKISNNGNCSVATFSATRGGFFADPYAGLVVQDQNTLYIVPRGSNNTADWITNFAGFSAEIGSLGVYGHAGIVDKADSMIMSLRQAIKSVSERSQINRVVFAGHSQGGATAQVLALLNEQIFQGTGVKNDNCKVLAISAPAVFDSSTVNRLGQLSKQITRVEMSWDAVTWAHQLLSLSPFARSAIGTQYVVGTAESLTGGLIGFTNFIWQDLMVGNLGQAFASTTNLSASILMMFLHGAQRQGRGGHGFDPAQYKDPKKADSVTGNTVKGALAGCYEYATNMVAQASKLDPDSILGATVQAVNSVRPVISAASSLAGQVYNGLRSTAKSWFGW